MTPLQRACIVLAYRLEVLRRWGIEAASHAEANPVRVESKDGKLMSITWSILPPPKFDEV